VKGRKARGDLHCISPSAKEMIQICTYKMRTKGLVEISLQVLLDHRLFGGGFGLGTPVVS
jgi:hypothetical protein